MLLDIINQHAKIHTYSKDANGRGVSINEGVIKSFGLASASDYLGMTDMDLPDQELYAPTWIENDCRIMMNGEGEMLLELCNCAGTLQWFRSYKSPLIGHSGNVLGITGISLKISEKSLIHLSKQQTACLKYLAAGLTHKHIGKTLGISQKTVEHYLDAVKLKLGLKTRVELITHAIERGLVGCF